MNRPEVLKQRFQFTFAILCLVSLIAILPVSGALNYYQITNNSASEANIDTDLDGSGFIHAVYERAGQIYYTKGLDSEELIGAGTNPAIAVDLNAVPHVAYLSSGSLNYTKRVSGVWVVAVTLHPGGESSADIDTDSNNFVHIIDAGNYDGDGYAEIMYWNNTVGGSFTSTMQWDGWYADHQGNYFKTPRITVDTQNYYHMVVHQQNWGGQASWSNEQLTYRSNRPDMTDRGSVGYTWATLPGLTQNALVADNTNTAVIAYIYGGRLISWMPSSGSALDLAAASSPAIARNASAIGIAYVNTATGAVEYRINQSAGFNPATQVVNSATGPALALGSLYNYYLKSDGVDNEVWLATDQTFDFPPSANFIANVTSGTVPLAVRFTDSSTGSPTTWNWSFGDGSLNTLQHPIHTFTSTGSFTVSLNATNAGGSNSTRKTGYITVTGLPVPIANFTANVTTGMAPLPVSFTDLSSNFPTGWAWYFGDENWMAPWTEVNASAWPARYGHSSVAMPDGSIILMGGCYDNVDKNDVWRSIDNGATWTQQTASAEWSVRSHHRSVAMPDGSIVLMGGCYGYTNYNDVWRSTDNGVTWTLVNASAGWSARYGHSSVAMPDGSIILMGGYDGSYKNDVWRSTDNGATWTPVNASAGWSAREYSSSVALPDGSIILMGGSDGDVLNDVWRSIDNGATWAQETATAGWSARYGHTSVAMPDGSIVLLGGTGVSFNNDVWLSTDNGATWAQLTASAGWSARHSHSSVAMPDGSIVLMGGTVSNAGGGCMNDVWRFVPSGSSVQNPTHTYATPGNYQVALQAYNAGGYNSTRKTGYVTVTRLPVPVANFTTNVTAGTAPLSVSFTDLSSNTPTGWAWYFGDETYTAPWTQQTASAEWSARAYPSSVSLPDGRILLMGGHDGSVSKNDVWRSDDAGATWVQLPDAGWTARYDQSSIVMPDGSIILTGGQAAIGMMNDVWRSTDGGATWTQMNTSAGWTARGRHTSVAMPDGSVVLMGGYDTTSNYLNDVWRSMDNGVTWTQVNPSAGWTGRTYANTVVMPDNSIVIMGGRDALGYKNDVWRSTDNGVTWTQVNPSAGWTARHYSASDVMPDGSIVLMGGQDGDGFKNDMWRSTDGGETWTQVTPSAGWSARAYHTSVALPDGSIVLLSGYNGGYFNDVWRFVTDGSSAQNPMHTYATPGNYQVALQAYNAGGYNSTRKTGYITVADMLIADFVANVTTGTAPLPVQFYDGSMNFPLTWNWTFGDGGTSTGQNPLHTYAATGTYPVSLTVTKPFGGNTTTKTGYIRVTSTPPPVPLVQTYSLIGKWGSTGGGDGQFSNAYGVAIDSNGNVSVVDTENNRVEVFSVNGTYQRQWGSDGRNPGQFSRPHGIAQDLAGNVYVIDTLNQRIQKFSSDGTFLLEWGSSGGGDGQFSNPVGIAVDRWGYVYVGDNANNRVQKFSPDGTYQLQWGSIGSGDGQFRQAYGVAVDPNGNVYVADHFNYRIQRFSANGAYITQWGSAGTGDGQFGTSGTGDCGPYHVSVDSEGYVYVADPGNNRIQKFTSDGTFIANWGSTESDGGFNGAYGVTVDNNGVVFVADTFNNRVQDFTRTPLKANFTANVTAGNAPVAVQFNDTSSGIARSWNWTFGDGSRSTLKNPVHIFSVTGNYTVMLIAANEYNEQNTSFMNIAVLVPPVANFTANRTVGTAPLTVQFNDTSSGSPITWTWSFGDGSVATVQNPVHTYTTGGTFNVSLNATNAGGSNTKTVRDYITVIVPAPIANFSASPTSGTAPLTVRFSDVSTNSPTSWNWNFGDSSSVNATVQHPIHTFANAGTYTVSLNATNAGGFNTSTRTNYITVIVPAPTANFSATPTTGTAPLTVRFTDSSTNSPTSWSWNFGDMNLTAQWTQVNASAGWSARTGHSSVVLPDGSIVLMGGSDSTGRKNDVWRSTDKGTTWTQVNASAGWSARSDHSSVALSDGSIVLMGGFDGSRLNDVWRSTNNGVTWTKVNASTGWSGRYAHSTVAMPDGSIVLTGGADNFDVKKDVWRSTDKGTTWTLMTTSAGWSARYVHSSVAMPDGSIILMGGRTSASVTTYVNDVWRSLDNGITWTQMNASAGWSPRTGHSSIVMKDSSIMLMGGVNNTGTSMNDIWQSKDSGATWTKITASATWSARGYHRTVGMKDGSIILMGGYTGSSFLNDVWRFMSAGSAEQHPVHTYTNAGTYTVSLNVTNAGGSNTKTVRDYITVTEPVLPPVSNFSATPTSGTAPLTVRFSDTSTNTPTAWNWNFGDGSTVNATVQHPVHPYAAAGNYTVSLNVTNTAGSNTTTRTNYITVIVPAPVANFSATPTTGRAPLTVLFTDASTNTPASWNWSFGDGALSNATNPVHTFTVVGNYSVSLKVTNSGGSNSTTRVNYISVTQSPPSATLYVTNVTGIGRNQTGITGIYLNNSFNPKVGSATVKLYYNASIITAQSAQIMAGGVVPTNLSSPITLAIATTSGIPNGNTWLANVTFRSEQNAEMISDLGLALITLDDLNIPPQDLIDSTRIQNGTFKTGGGVQVNVIDASGNPMTADRIALESGTGTMNVTGVNSYRFSAVPTGMYQVNVTKSGYIGVNTTINYAAGSMRVLTATLVTHAYQPTVILTESGVALSGMTRTPPERLNAQRNETDQYNLTLNGGGVISVALEYPMRYQLNRPQLTSALPVGTEMRNGTFLWTTPFYTTTNATLIVTAVPVSGQTFVGLKFTGGKLGDVYYDTKVTSTDSLYDLHYVVTNLRSLSTYDYADVNRDGKITSTDALYILHYVVGNVNEYYQAA